jgi:hypothetical protein
MAWRRALPMFMTFPKALKPYLADSLDNRHRFLPRLEDEWSSNANGFMMGRRFTGA